MNQTNTDQVILSSLDDMYGVMRRLQGDFKENPGTQATKCIGAGNCCKIGLAIPLLECHNIAKQLRREFWIKHEAEGKSEANRWYNKIVFKLKDAFVDPDWTIEDETATKRSCVFFSRKGGCSIYEYRPFVCRAYGTIAPVDPTCPRNRDEDGNVVIFMGQEVDQIIKRFDKIVEAYGKANPQLNYSMFMPLGVLRFLLPEREFAEFFKTVDPKFTKAVEGYHHQLWKVREDAKDG